MAEVIVAQRMWQRRDTAANWTSVNPVLARGEIGVEIEAGATNSKMKFGNGTDAWVDLPYFGGAGGNGLLTVSGAPGSGVGEDGDYAIDPNSGNPILYGPKASGTWPAGIALKGADGADGTNGTNGVDGLSAYEVAVANGFVGSESDWLASLVGPAGPAGGSSANRGIVVTGGSKDGAALAAAMEISGIAIADYTLTGNWYLWCYPAGSIELDIWVDNFANAPPDAADSIVAGNYPAIASDDSASGNYTGWATTAIARSDAVTINVRSVSAVKWFYLLLEATT